MSAQNLINYPLSEIRSFLKQEKIELKETKFPDVYIIKFTSETDVTHPNICTLKGLIFNHAKKQILSMTYPVPIEYKDLENDAKHEIIEQLSKEKYIVQELLDGTLFRYSYFPEQQKWILSTNGKEDADDAYWMNGISLAKQFESIKESKFDLNLLNQNYVYMFVMYHPLNVIVVNHKYSKLYHLATYDRTTMSEIDCNIGIEKPKLLDLNIQQLDQLIKEANDKPVESAGYMVICQSNNLTRRLRFENANYTRAKLLRGNSNNLDFTLLELIHKGDQFINEFMSYYPLYQGNCDHIKYRLKNLINKFYFDYGKRYKKHEFIQVHSRHHKFLFRLHHEVYLNKLKSLNKTVQLEDVRQFVMAQEPALLLYLLNYIYDTTNYQL
jgi:hypothetical protein